ncbi:MAG TPA: hypothetical protein VMD59_17890, partial [Acidimicrobiales bacterium]|nr:hypothetical protein [Acidimicrobiales bacterium]
MTITVRRPLRRRSGQQRGLAATAAARSVPGLHLLRLPLGLVPLVLVAVCAGTGAAAATAPPSPGGAAMPAAAGAPPATQTCPAASWTLARDAEQTIVVPVAETGVAAVAPQVAAGVGGIVLFGSAAPSNLAAQLRSLAARAPGGIAP